MNLRAGPVSLEFDAELATIRDIRVAGFEAVRGVVAAVRDRNWDTVPGEVSDLQLREHEDSFELTFTCSHHNAAAAFTWRGRLTGSAEGVIVFEFDGQALEDFDRNRIGFCVLHAMECAGLECSIEHVDGSVTDSRFPVPISPHQPFHDIRSIRHSPASGITVEVRMEGDTFEMEDQRNWTDASYKTYCTPLDLPFPVGIAAGARVQQRIVITPTMQRRSTGAERIPDAVQTLQLTDDPAALLPWLGLCLPADGHVPEPAQEALLRSLKPAHLRIDLKLGSEERSRQLAGATESTVRLGSSLELALHLSEGEENAQLQWLSDQLDSLRPRIARFMIFHEAHATAPERWLRLAREVLGSDDRIPILTGTQHFFTELNRNRPAAGVADGVVYSVNPQVHAFDDRSLFETLKAQTVTTVNARALAAGGSVAVSPVTLKMRSNPNATGAEPALAPDSLPPQVDLRQRELFTAAWAVGSIRQLALGGADSATYFESTGWLGLMERTGGSPLPGLFASAPGEVFPVFHVLADVMEAGSRAVILHAHGAEAVSLRTRWGRRTILFNPGPDSKAVTISGLNGSVSYRVLDQDALELARLEPTRFRDSWVPAETSGASGSGEFHLNPYAVVTVDERTG